MSRDMRDPMRANVGSAANMFKTVENPSMIWDDFGLPPILGKPPNAAIKRDLE